jgi:hypothetical protein
MGGANLPQQAAAPIAANENQNAERIQKQGMSDQGIVSLGELKKEAVGTWNDLKGAVQKKMGVSGTPNSYGREINKSIDSIEQGLK